MRQHPLGDLLVVVGQIELGDAVFGIEDLVGMRETHAGHFVVSRLRRRTRRLLWRRSGEPVVLTSLLPSAVDSAVSGRDRGRRVRRLGRLVFS